MFAALFFRCKLSVVASVIQAKTAPRYYSCFYAVRFFSLTDCIYYKKNNKKENSCSTMNMHCHKSSIFAPVCHGQLLKHHQNIHPSIFYDNITCTQGPGGKSIKNRVMSENDAKKTKQQKTVLPRVQQHGVGSVSNLA